MSEASEFERSNSSYSAAQSHMAMLPNYYRWTYGSFSHLLSGRVLELGAGAGLGVETYLSQVSKVIAADHDPLLLADLRTRAPAVETVALDLLGDWEALQGLDVDVTIMMDVIEHFEDPGAFVRKLHKVLRPGGLALIKVPAQQRLYSAADRASGHYKRYDLEDLNQLMGEAGFQTLMLRYMNRVGALAYKRRGKKQTNFSRTFSKTQLRVINAAIPVIALVDRILPGPGLSLVGAFRRPK